MNTLQILEMYKKQIARNEGLKEVSDYLAAQRLGVTRSAVSHWRNRGGAMDEETAIKIADYCDLDEGELLAWIFAERTKSPAARRALEKLAKLAHSAAAVVLLTILVGFQSPQVEAKPFFESSKNIHYTHN